MKAHADHYARLGARAPRFWAHERPRQRTVSRRGGPELRRHGEQNEKVGSAGEVDEGVANSGRNAEPEGGGRNDEQHEQEPSVPLEGTTADETPRFSPMPVPIVDEPCTPTSEKAKLASASGGSGHPRASTSPISACRHASTWHSLSVSSLGRG